MPLKVETVNGCSDLWHPLSHFQIGSVLKQLNSDKLYMLVGYPRWNAHYSGVAVLRIDDGSFYPVPLEDCCESLFREVKATLKVEL